jgi:hypothetical protein
VYIGLTADHRRDDDRPAVLYGNRLALPNRVLGATRAVAADNVADAPTPHVPICPNCGQEGREHRGHPEPGRHSHVPAGKYEPALRPTLDRSRSPTLACAVCGPVRHVAQRAPSWGPTEPRRVTTTRDRRGDRRHGSPAPAASGLPARRVEIFPPGLAVVQNPRRSSLTFAPVLLDAEGPIFSVQNHRNMDISIEWRSGV